MVFINVRELSKLIETAENRGGLEQKVAEFQEKHSIKILLEEYETLVDLAIKINKREKGKAHDNSKKSSTAEVFTYGELKLFSWTLFLYCFTRTLSLTQLVLLITLRAKMISSFSPRFSNRRLRPS